MIRFLGIDPGLASTGWGIVSRKGNQLSYTDSGTITTKAGLDDPERLKLIFESLQEVLEEYKPQAVAVETLYFAKNVKSALPVAQARGVMLLTCRLNQVPVSELTPLQIKQSVVGVGRAEKKQVFEMVKLILGIRELTISDHAADALAAAVSLYHLKGAAGV